MEEPENSTSLFIMASTTSPAATTPSPRHRIILEASPEPGIDKKNKMGETKLQQAVIGKKKYPDPQARYAEVLELLQAGASVTCFCNFGWTPLHEACNKGDAEMIKLLLQREPEVQVNSIGGWNVEKEKYTPLHDAAENGYLECVKILVNYGANLGAKTADGFTPVQLAEHEKHEEVVKYLKAVETGEIKVTPPPKPEPPVKKAKIVTKFPPIDDQPKQALSAATKHEFTATTNSSSKKKTNTRPPSSKPPSSKKAKVTPAHAQPGSILKADNETPANSSSLLSRSEKPPAYGASSSTTLATTPPSDAKQQASSSSSKKGKKRPAADITTDQDTMAREALRHLADVSRSTTILESDLKEELERRRKAATFSDAQFKLALEKLAQANTIMLHEEGEKGPELILI